MDKVILYLALALVAAEHQEPGPTSPYRADNCTTEGTKTVDAKNMCWYWECTMEEDSNYSQLSIRCPMGYKIGYNYISGESQPCTIMITNVTGDNCSRTNESVDGPPECHANTTCQNGGTPVYESTMCWCECPVDLQVNDDCSLPSSPQSDELPTSPNTFTSGAGPTRPLSDSSCAEEGMKTADAGNMCWYWECTLTESGEGLKMIPRVCALGSRVSYNFVSAVTNPCTVNFDDVIGYDCRREQPSVDGPPECHPKTCENGGTAVYESNMCWCDCPPSWQGDHDCSKPTRDPADLPPSSNICVDGEPQEDWCAKSPCLNGGTCFNQCDTYYCLCPDRDTVDHWGKNCEFKPEEEA